MSQFGFHPIIEQWFESRFRAPTEPQRLGWPHIAAGRHTLIAAPTGSGKTLTAFLSIIDRLVKLRLEGQLEDETRVVYVSPLRALSNDMHRNLETPLQEITALAAGSSLEPTAGSYPSHGSGAEELLRVGLRTGDTTSSRRAALVRRPPHILVTTPESLYLMLTAEKGRETLRSVDTIIVDEIHALVRDKRGSHFALSMERLQHVCERPLQRIGLSATQKPIERMAEFLVGSATDAATECAIVDVGHDRELDLAIEVPASELGAVCMHEQWAEVNSRIVDLINQHRSTLIFVNTRRLAERLTHQLTDLLGDGVIGTHHGSLATDVRLGTERRLKSGELKAVVATSSLELGLDIGYIDLVIQIGSPRSIATFLQRIGRSGHSLGLVPKGRLFALTRDELLESMSLIRAVRAGRLDAVPIPEAPLDVLAQQIVAEVSAEDWSTDDLFALCRRAAPYRNLPREQFDRIVAILSEGLTNSFGRSRVYLHHDQVGRRLRARAGARIAAATNAGAIPEVGAYRVVLEPENTVVGTLDEDFATETAAGTIFQLGNMSWRFQYLRGSDVTVTDAHGAPPTIPFWRGEAPGRTVELSEEVSRLREELESLLSPAARSFNRDPAGSASCADAVQLKSAVDCPTDSGVDPDALPDASLFNRDPTGSASCADAVERQSAIGCLPDVGVDADALPAGSRLNEQTALATPSDVAHWLARETGSSEPAAQQIVEYVAAQKAAIGLVPTHRRVVFERFFDESGGMQLVVHAPFGSRINRAWGLAMRKRFCMSFDFELQATADDDGFILSLGPQHSFPLETLFGIVKPDNARYLLEKAVLTVPMFQIRWRWNATRALLVLRRQNGKKVPPAFQRFRADDLLSAVFPKATGCQENAAGDVEIPDHPLVQQTMEDCLHEALDLAGLQQILTDVRSGAIELIARDTREPSPFCYELLNANPYAFLDGGEIQERRTRAVFSRRSLTVESVRDLGRLDQQAIEQVRLEARPLVRNADELHDVLLSRIVLPVTETRTGLSFPGDDAASSNLEVWATELQTQQRSASIRLPTGAAAWIAAERLPAVTALFPDAEIQPAIAVPDGVRRDWSSADARVAVIRGLLETSGPITADEISARIGFTTSQASAALEALEGEGVVLRGHFTPPSLVPQQRGGEENLGHVFNVPDFATNTGTLETCPTDRSQPRRDIDATRRFTDQNLPDAGEPEGVSPRTTILVRGLTPSGSPGNLFPADRTTTIEWCHRRLLARIHRLTIEGLRSEIEPVGVEVWIRFLTRHHGVLPASRRSGTNGVFEVVAMLQGLDVPAVCWERSLLPLRIDGYRPEWLDELCLNGEVGWGRLVPSKHNPDRSKPMASLTRVAPISLYLRGDLAWLTTRAPDGEVESLSSPALQVFDLLRDRGAMFAADLMSETRMLPSQLDDALGELVTRSFVTADGFAGVRQLIRGRSDGNPSRRAKRRPSGAARRRSLGASSGRWSIWRRPGKPDEPAPAAAGVEPDETCAAAVVEQWAWQLLRRWGVIFRDVLTREPAAPRWFELLQVYRRLEARGEIRGGRFVCGVAGEQFALAETVRHLRQLRDESSNRTRTAADGHARKPHSVEHELVVISAADPLNLVGVVTSHARIPSTASNLVAFLDGVPIAALRSGEVEFFGEVPADIRATLVPRFSTIGIDGGHPTESVDSSASPQAASKKPAKRRTIPNEIPRPMIS